MDEMFDECLEGSAAAEFPIKTSSTKISILGHSQQRKSATNQANIDKDQREAAHPQVTSRLSTQSDMHSKSGQYYFCEPQTTFKKINSQMSQARFEAIRERFIKLKNIVSSEIMESMDRVIAQSTSISNEERKSLKDVIFQKKCDLWVIIGFLDHDLSLRRLDQVAKQYKDIRVVPIGYNQPMLWQQKEIPEYEKAIKMRKF